MLNQLRKGVGSWLVKILLGLLVISFAAWGIGDMFRVRTPNWVAKVGDVEIDRETVTQQFRREMQKLQQMFGRALDTEQARKLGLLDATVKQLVGGTLLDLEARKLGLDISDDAIARAIQENPSFRNQLGQFDRLQFEALLRQNGFSERSFIAQLKRDMLRSHLQSTVQAAGAMPDAVAERVYRHQMERRVAELLVFRNAAQGEVGEPDEASLAQFHQDNAQRFTAPELRAVTVVTLTAADLGQKQRIDDAELKQEYDSRIAEFTRAEKRDLMQLVVPEEAAARAAHERLVKGEDFATVAKEVANLSEADIAFDDVAKSDLPGELAAKAFALAEGVVSDPFQTPFGWHLVKVKAVRPGGIAGLDEVREPLRQAMALQRGGDEAAKLSRKLEDELAGGGALEEAAAKLELTLVKIAAMDARGNGADGNPAAGMPAIAELPRTAFAAQPGTDLQLHETTGGGYFVVRVDGVTPPALKPLDSVRAEAVTAWKEDRRDQASRAKATQALEKLNAGADPATLARELGADLKTTEPILRSGDGAGPELSQQLIVAIFALDPGKATVGATAGRDGHVLARVTEVKPAETDQTAVQRLEKSLADSMGTDLLQQFSQALEKTYPVKIDDKALETLF